MNTINETVSFDEWKVRFNAGDEVGYIALQELTIADGLVYGRVNIESCRGSKLVLAHFVVNSECQVRTVADFQHFDPTNPVIEEGARNPEGPVVGLFWQDGIISSGSHMDLQYFDPRSNNARGSIFLREVGAVIISPYPGGFQDGELTGLINPTAELLDSVFAPNS